MNQLKSSLCRKGIQLFNSNLEQYLSPELAGLLFVLVFVGLKIELAASEEESVVPNFHSELGPLFYAYFLLD
jgi:hypothetical protein